ncbi:hypothetical protein [Pontibacillus halophilus]|uniref:hypothetical protein n=1 Tax=Pontibacillus halophilus TaxID=516704 RepID=UPI001B7FE29B|nr:hypothetical protein [Pontibacillus halophilus]
MQFRLSSPFGFFQWGETLGDRRVSTPFLSKTEVLGMIGGMLGMPGYAQEMTIKRLGGVNLTPFYEVLSGLEVAIIPSAHPTWFEDHLIHRHMEHINLNGALQVEMMGLTKPSFQVVIRPGTVDNSIYCQIVDKLNKKSGVFPPFMGKNQFPVEVSDVQKVFLSPIRDRRTTIDSLYRFESVKTEPEVYEFEIEDGEYHYGAQLKFYVPGNEPQIERRQCFWSSFEATFHDVVYETDNNLRLVFL